MKNFSLDSHWMSLWSEENIWRKKSDCLQWTFLDSSTTHFPLFCIVHQSFPWNIKRPNSVWLKIWGLRVQTSLEGVQFLKKNYLEKKWIQNISECRTLNWSYLFIKYWEKNKLLNWNLFIGIFYCILIGGFHQITEGSSNNWIYWRRKKYTYRIYLLPCKIQIPKSWWLMNKALYL